jgi:hypothetical protein
MSRITYNHWNASIVIQSALRGYFMRKRYKLILNWRLQSAIKLQSWMKGNVCRKAAAELRYQLNLLNSSIKIQVNISEIYVITINKLRFYFC